MLIDEEAIKTQKAIKVEGYFTLSNKILSLGTSISKTNRKKIFNGLPSEESCVHTILIGQLGKHIIVLSIFITVIFREGFLFSM